MARKKTYQFKSNNKVAVEFCVARSSAIAAYADVERALVELFAHLMNVTPDYAGIPFFRLNNARARNTILGQLLRKRHGSTYSLFWNPIEKELKKLDDERNEIVHWGIFPVFKKTTGKLVKMKLIPPNYWNRNPTTPKKTVRQMYEFIIKCKFFVRSLDVLRHVASGQKPEEASWREMCQQPIAYPPPSNHPLSPTMPEPKILVQSSPGSFQIRIAP